jgi:hypothetical protein
MKKLGSKHDPGKKNKKRNDIDYPLLGIGNQELHIIY